MDDIVISTDDYELYRSKRGAFLPLLQAHLSSGLPPWGDPVSMLVHGRA